MNLIIEWPWGKESVPYTSERLDACYWLGDQISFSLVSDNEQIGLDDQLKRLERDSIIRALRLSNGKQSKAAAVLGITRRALHYKIHTVHKIRWNTKVFFENPV